MDNIDWKTAGSGTREVYPTGTYKVEITGWQECESKKGTLQIRWFGEIKDPDEFKGKSIVEHTALSSNSLWRIANLVEACGIDLSEAPSTQLLSEAFKKMLDICVGRTSYWQVKFDEQWGNNKVEKYIMDEKQPTIQPELGGDVDPECPFPDVDVPKE